MSDIKKHVKWLFSKKSYQGADLKNRIAGEAKRIAVFEADLRRAKRDWLQAELTHMNAVDRLKILLEVSSYENRRRKP